MDIGGGTYDLTIAEIHPGQDPIIRKNDFGSDVGGSDVDLKFMETLKEITGIIQVNIPELKK